MSRSDNQTLAVGFNPRKANQAFVSRQRQLNTDGKHIFINLLSHRF